MHKKFEGILRDMMVQMSQDEDLNYEFSEILELYHKISPSSHADPEAHGTLTVIFRTRKRVEANLTKR